MTTPQSALLTAPLTRGAFGCGGGFDKNAKTGGWGFFPVPGGVSCGVSGWGLCSETENARCRRAARKMDENMLYWYCGAKSRDGLPPKARL